MSESRSMPMPRMQFKRGDVVRVIQHGWYQEAVGMIFIVEQFSSNDGLEDNPIVLNPFRERDYDQTSRWNPPLYLRFNPDQLELLSVLDRLAIL